MAKHLLKPMTKEEIMAAIFACREQLGHTPSMVELCRHTEIRQGHIQKHFGFYTRALSACNMKPNPAGNLIPMERLFLDWAVVVRELKKIPSFTEYEQHASYTRTPLKTRCERWTMVPTAMRQHMEANKLTAEWGDVLSIITAYEKLTGVDEMQLNTPVIVKRPKLREDRMIYGPPVGPAALAHGPVNELGVIYLFGTMAERLGFVVTHIQHAFPDCEAMRNMGDDQWQRVTIEFEYESRNFVKHLHDANACDLIVCWRHNWEECPVEVVELRREVRMQ